MLTHLAFSEHLHEHESRTAYAVSGADTASFLYAPRGPPDNQRVKGVVNGVTSYYPNQYYEVTGGVVKTYYYAAGALGAQRIAMQDGALSRTLLTDHLGGTAYAVSAATEVGEVRYKPFGATRYTGGTTPTSFRYTGQREEAGLGLYYYGARWYDPALGRFIQPDTIVPNAADARSYDHYAYALNNPLKYNDPSGHYIFSLLDGAAALVTEGGALVLAPSAVGADAVCWAAVIQYGNQAVNTASQFADKVPALWDRLFNSSSSAQNATQSSNFGQFDPSNFNFDPNQFDPDKTKKVTEIGQEAHRGFREEFRQQMQKLGREEKAGDFLTERGVRDALGRVARIEGQYG